MRITVCLKFVDRRPEADEDGAVVLDDRFAGVSAADQAALEWALVLADALDAGHSAVQAVTYGPSAADRVLRDALACGAGRAIRIAGTTDVPSSAVAGAIADVLDREQSQLVVCGDHSVDRGSGSMPAFLAARRAMAAALGLLHLEVEGGTLLAVRRLDGGRREQLRVTLPAVVSVEGGTVRLRRASLSAALQATSAAIEVVTPVGRVDPRAGDISGTLRPYRPRSRALAAPSDGTALQRIVALTGAGSATSSSSSSAPLSLAPARAAERILATIADWGYELPTT
jgi:electron transfer flavoprotein beta subunit